MFTFRMYRQGNCFEGIVVTIDGCPASGIEAIDFRRANGLPEEASNTIVALDHEIVSESLVRAASAIMASPESWDRARGNWGAHSTDHYTVALPAQVIREVLTGSEPAILAVVQAYADAVQSEYEARVQKWLRKPIDEWIFRLGTPYVCGPGCGYSADIADDPRMLARREEAVAFLTREQEAERESREQRRAQIAAARELLADELEAGRVAKANLRTVAEFLAAVPDDALRGTLRTLTESAGSTATAELRAAIEDASPVTIFDADEDADEDDGDESED